MNTKVSSLQSNDRRKFLQASAAVAGVAAFPWSSASAPQRPKYRRVNVNDPALGPPMLASYKKAIAAMLALPPSDPRNWYRIALVHTMDCPHGNWWFLVWHRAYIGWFEQICRELSGDSQFALPYWDWSENRDPTQPFRPAVPNAMFEDILTPAHTAFIDKGEDFRNSFRDTLAKADYWTPAFGPNGEFVEDSPYAQLLARGVRFPEDLWFDILDDPRGSFFFDRAHARGLTREQPYLDDKTSKAVSQTMLLDALAPRDFLTFASPKTFSHSGLTGFGVLEGQAHNRVHNNVGGISSTQNIGGFMQANLSPVDPLFFLHHANIDRLWDVWTRKQQARNYPYLPSGYPAQPGASVPDGSDYAAWASEPFVFFVDAKGQGLPEAKKRAGFYASIGEFDYDYQPGSGEEVVASLNLAFGASKPPLTQPIVVPTMTSTNATALEFPRVASGTFAVPSALLQAPPPNGTGPALYAQITISLPPLVHGGDLAVVVNAPGDALAVAPSSPHYAGTLSMFGHHTMHGPVTFTVPLSSTVAALRTQQLLKTNEPLNVTVVAAQEAIPPRVGMLAHAAHFTTARPAQILSIVVESH